MNEPYDEARRAAAYVARQWAQFAAGIIDPNRLADVLGGAIPECELPSQ